VYNGINFLFAFVLSANDVQGGSVSVCDTNLMFDFASAGSAHLDRAFNPDAVLLPAATTTPVLTASAAPTAMGAPLAVNKMVYFTVCTFDPTICFQLSPHFVGTSCSVRIQQLFFGE
jgi:hypothetical protein